MILHYLKVALRNLIARKWQTLICAVGLSMGILSFTLCLYLVTLTTEVNSQFPEYKQMAKLIPLNDKGGRWYSFPYAALKQLEEAQLPEIRAIVLSQSAGYEVCSYQISEKETKPFETSFYTINRGVPAFYSFRLTDGQLDEAFRYPHSLLISEHMAKRVYGNSSPIGKIVTIKKQDYTIRGVVQALARPNYLSGTYQAELFYCAANEQWDSKLVKAHLLLTPDTDLDKLNQTISHLGISFNYEQADPAFGLGTEAYHFKIEELNADSKGLKGTLTYLPITGIGFLVLLSGLINFFSLSIGSFYNRTRELSLRKSIGAESYHLFGQLFTELLLIILLATLLSFCLSETFLPYGLQQLESIQPTGFYLDRHQLFRQQLLIFGELLLACAVMTALAVYRIQRIPAMRGVRGGNITGTRHRVRNFLLGVQFFICFFFLGAATILHQQVKAGEDSPSYSSFPADEQKRTYVVPLTFEQVEGLEHEVIRQLIADSHVADYLYSDHQLLSAENTSRKQIDGLKKLRYTSLFRVSPDFSSFFHLPLIEGKYPEHSGQVLISESLAKLLDKEGLNGSLMLDSVSYQVCGILKDAHLSFKFDNQDFAVTLAEHPRYCLLKAHPGQEEKLMQHIQRVMHQWVPETLPLHVATFHSSVNQVLLKLSIMRNITLTLSLVCLFITILGIYSAITLDTERRRKEVAIRKVNGATFRTIVFLFGQLYIRIFCITAAFALPILWLGANSALQSFRTSYNINNPLLWCMLLLLTACIITLIIGYQLYKTARTNPAETIKTE